LRSSVGMRAAVAIFVFEHAFYCLKVVTAGPLLSIPHCRWTASREAGIGGLVGYDFGLANAR
jgi:hypothetical protein